MDVGRSSTQDGMSTTPISILMFCNTTVRAGVEEHILELLRGLDRQQFQPHLACPQVLLDQFGSDIPKDVHVTPIMLDGLVDFRDAVQLARALRERKIGILHSHMFRASLFASPIGKLCRVPVIIETAHSCEVWRRGWLKSRYIVDRLMGPTVDCFIGVSDACGRFLAEKKKLPARKIRVIRNGCPLEKFDPERSAPAGMRHSLGFAENDPVMVALARLDPQKGHHVLLDAMPQALKEFPNARLVCVGNGILREKLEKQAESLSITHAVRFVGYQTNPQDWLALADFTVLPSYYEGLPLVAIESLAAGRTMVATAVDGTPDVILDGKTGLTVPPGDSARMAEAMCTLLRDPSLRKKLALAGRQHVLAEFSAQRFVHDTAQLYLDAWACRTQRSRSWAIRGTEKLAVRASSECEYADYSEKRSARRAGR